MQKFHVKMMLFAAVVAGVAVADEAFQCEFWNFQGRKSHSRKINNGKVHGWRKKTGDRNNET